MSDFRNSPGILVIHLEGQFDARSALAIEEVLQEALSQGRYCIVLDCGSLTYISSAALGVLMAYVEEVREEGGDIKIAAGQPQVMNLLDMLGFPMLFEVAELLEDAIERWPAQKHIDHPIEHAYVSGQPYVGGIAVVSVEGVWGDDTATPFERTVQEVLSEQRYRIVIDCRNLRGIGSSGLDVLSRLMTRLRDLGGDLRLAALRPKVHRSLVTTELITQFSTYSTVTEAFSGWLEGAGDSPEGPIRSFRVDAKDDLPVRFRFIRGIAVIEVRQTRDSDLPQLLTAAVQKLTDRNRLRIVLDCTAVRDISNATADAIKASVEHIESLGGEIRLASRGSEYRTAEEAINSFLDEGNGHGNERTTVPEPN